MNVRLSSDLYAFLTERGDGLFSAFVVLDRYRWGIRDCGVLWRGVFK